MTALLLRGARDGAAQARAALADAAESNGVLVRLGARAEQPLQALAFLAHSLEAAAEPHRVVLMHAPPAFDGRYAPHPEWGFSVREREFLDIVRRHDVDLVCCAHALLFDHHVHRGTHFVVSGGDGTGLCSHFRGICTAGEGRPEDRGALFHAVEIAIGEAGGVSGRLLQAFDPVDGHARLRFGG